MTILPSLKVIQILLLLTFLWTFDGRLKFTAVDFINGNG